MFAERTMHIYKLRIRSYDRDLVPVRHEPGIKFIESIHNIVLIRDNLRPRPFRVRSLYVNKVATSTPFCQWAGEVGAYNIKW